VIYAGTTLLFRWRENRSLEQQSVRQRAEHDRKVVERYGDGELKVLAFYANPPVIRRGSKGLLCYGVANAASVRIEPHVDDTNPSLSRCVETAPNATTTYTLTATDASGRAETRTVDVAVR
jgi:hypothetical protein